MPQSVFNIFWVSFYVFSICGNVAYVMMRLIFDRLHKKEFRVSYKSIFLYSTQDSARNKMHNLGIEMLPVILKNQAPAIF